MTLSWCINELSRENTRYRDRWENIPYKVLAKVNPGHLVYKVRNDGEDHVRILHHNMVLPLVAPEDSTGCDPEPCGSRWHWCRRWNPYVDPITRNRAKAQALYWPAPIQWEVKIQEGLLLCLPLVFVTSLTQGEFGTPSPHGSSKVV